ncbi:glucosaminidase domain-containing protein [Vagococcus zengguangii]|uniref:glucosaminidase domain-containing protein n=1 Tax=Vagococcus zengguangii TaxID=2571750 RepID=UPI001107D308|nr:glucosaminidase domain-containing protein [Vagococcus zengguangii]TLG81708.1 CHAP domain-containing protein [Vagococcus zengguangii]
MKKTMNTFLVFTVGLYSTFTFGSPATVVLAATQQYEANVSVSEEGVNVTSDEETEETTDETSQVVPEEPQEPQIPEESQEPQIPEESQEPQIPEESQEPETTPEEPQTSESTPEESQEKPTQPSKPVEITDSSQVSSESSTTETTSNTPTQPVPSTKPSTEPSTETTTSSESKAPNFKPSKKPAEKPAQSIIAKEQSGVDATPTIQQPISNAIIDLGETTKDFTASNLLNYRLPLLSELKTDKEAVLIYGSLLLVGKERFEDENNQDKKTGDQTNKQAQKDKKAEKNKPITSKELVTWLGKQYFNQDLLSENARKLTDKDTIQVGDIVVWTNYLGQTQYGLYIGDDLLITVENVDDERFEVVTQYYVENDDQTIYRNDKLELNKAGQALLKQYPASMDFKANPLTEKFIQSIGENARELGLKYDVFASVMIAQALLESASGTSGLAQAPNHNLFGIKGQYQNQSISMATSEDDGKGNLYTIQSAFRKYPSYQESLKDYVSLIKNGTAWKDDFYKDAWRSEANNYLTAAQSLKGKYATDTQYDKKVISLIATYNLTQYDEPKLDTSVTGKTSGILTSRTEIPKEYRDLMKFPDYNQKNYNTSGSYPVGQCTWYAFNRVAQLGMSVDDYMGNGGEWGAKGKRLGYTVTSTPKAGYLVSFLPGVAGSSSQYGHVAFVEAVTKDGILISEGNVVGGTRVSYRVISNEIARSSQVNYIVAKQK